MTWAAASNRSRRMMLARSRGDQQLHGAEEPGDLAVLLIANVLRHRLIDADAGTLAFDDGKRNAVDEENDIGRRESAVCSRSTSNSAQAWKTLAAGSVQSMNLS